MDEFVHRAETKRWDPTRRPGYTDPDLIQSSYKLESGPLLRLSLRMNPGWASRAEEPTLPLNRFDCVAHCVREQAAGHHTSPLKGLGWGAFI